jgi:hypothetical protein
MSGNTEFKVIEIQMSGLTGLKKLSLKNTLNIVKITFL